MHCFLDASVITSLGNGDCRVATSRGAAAGKRWFYWCEHDGGGCGGGGKGGCGECIQEVAATGLCAVCRRNEGSRSVVVALQGRSTASKRSSASSSSIMARTGGASREGGGAGKLIAVNLPAPQESASRGQEAKGTLKDHGLTWERKICRVCVVLMVAGLAGVTKIEDRRFAVSKDE